MKIIIFKHPTFSTSQSMPRFAQMIFDAMDERGYLPEFWTATPLVSKIPAPPKLKKWLGYIDQFIIFPLQIRWRLQRVSENTLFVFSDQALGPWISSVANRPHVIHVHDFMALRSSLGEYAQNPTNWTGRHYQALIRRGFEKGKNFLSVSENTQQDLHRFLSKKPVLSEVIYNGMNYPYRPMGLIESKTALALANITIPESGFLLHVGGNQWYKNREGVLEIYKAYAKQTSSPLPLWMIGAPPTQQMKKLTDSIDGNAQVRFMTGLSNEQLCAVYSSARLLIFPSLAEGFGWPIAEAMACGCLVLTTAQAPMTEVGGNAALYIPPKPSNDKDSWATLGAIRVSKILDFINSDTQAQKELGYAQVAQFEAKRTLDTYERVYLQVLARGTE